MGFWARAPERRHAAGQRVEDVNLDQEAAVVMGKGRRPPTCPVGHTEPRRGTPSASVRLQSTDQIMDEALTRLGMPVPDSALARRARALITDVAAPFLVNHSVRCYAWGVELARHDRLQFDPEILYVSSILHDIGLVPAYDLGGCYEVDGAIAAERLVREAGEPEARARAIYDVIALHDDETLPPDSASEVVLLWDSAGTDVTGHRFADVRPAIIPGLLAAYPRVDFKREFTALLVDQASRKPTCPAAEMIATGILDEITQAPFDS
jgi:HD domain